MSQNRLIVLLLAVLVIVVGGSLLVLLSGASPSVPGSPLPEAPGSAFDLDVLEQQTYQLLNKQLVREGALPVQPPATAGKANPFI